MTMGKSISKIILLVFCLIIFGCRKDAKLIEGSIEQIDTIGYPGTYLGEFQFSSGSDVGWTGEHDGEYLYIADTKNNRVQRFDKQNKVKDWWGYKSGELGFHTNDTTPDDSLHPSKIYAKNGHIYIAAELGSEYLLFKINTEGKLIYKLPIRITGFSTFCVDSKENVFVYNNDDIIKYNSNGELLTKFAGYGREDGLLANKGYVIQIVIDDEGYVYAVDAGNSRIQKYDNDGNFIKNWGLEIYLGYTPMYYFNNTLHLFENGYLVEYDTEGTLLRKWKKKNLHGNQQIIVTDSKIYEPNQHDHIVKVYEYVNN